MRAIVFVLLVGVMSCASDDVAFLKDLKKDNISGRFTQTKQISGVKLIASGEFTFDNKIFIQHIIEPLPLRVKIDESGIWEWNGSSFVPSKTLFDRELFLAILEVDLESLKKDFEIKISGDSNSWDIELSPLGIIAKVFKLIKISGGNSISSLELIENNGDFTAYNFEVLGEK